PIDADLAVNPGALADAPLLAQALTGAGFTAQGGPGAWLSPDGIPVDLMVPEALAGPGRRGARLGAHGHRVARRAKGLEAALVDHDLHTIRALARADTRSATVAVAGPGALLVAKVRSEERRVGKGYRKSAVAERVEGMSNR